MPPRSLELFDLPKLPRYHSEVISLDSRRALTRGNPLRAVNFLMHLNPKRRIYTGIAENGDAGTILGGIVQRKGESFAHLTYLAPSGLLDESKESVHLIEHLSAQAGKWRAHQVLAEVGEDSPLFQPLRQSGFAVYDRQRVWNLSEIPLSLGSTSHWRKQETLDMISIQNLQRQIVPPILQPIEAFAHSTPGLVCQADELLAYVDVTYGSHGIFLRPLIHPNIENVREKLLFLLASLPNRRERPVYLCIRSYQAWLETTLEDVGASAGPRQTVMVKHLVNVVRERKTAPVKREKAWANPATSIRQKSKTTNK